MKIIPATKEHLDQISEIYQYYILNSVATFRTTKDGTLDVESFYKDHQKRSLPLLVALEEDQVIGYCYLYPYKKEYSGYNHTFCDTIYINPNHLGKSVGSKLLESMILESKANSKVHNIISKIAIDIGQEVNASIALHKKFGFVVVGRMSGVGYKDDQVIDVVTMQLKLN